MIELNEKDFTLEIKEFFDFNHHVMPVIEQLIEFDERVEEKLKDYQFTDQDKIDILNQIKDDYEYQMDDIGAYDIFDYELIRESIMTWIENNF